VTLDLVAGWLRDGRLDLPLPGKGETKQRWRRLAELTEVDVVAGRLAEAHADAVAILAELGGRIPLADQLWGVWAAEVPGATVTARRAGDGVSLDGTKAWCSGAGLCTCALVTARVDDSERGLFSVDLRDDAVQPLPSTWRNCGMAASDTRSVEFRGAPAIPVGRPGDYLARPGFWFGAIGVAACWLGGARAVAMPLYQRVAAGAADDHAAAHLGAVDAAITAAEATLAAAADHIDADPDNRSGTAELTARRARAVVETAVDQTIIRTARALGPGPLCLDEQHARRVADLTVYVRQSHAERDLAALGVLAADAPASS
jgi:alkylation response protein AidB-like acyl-CoA dehydrogenase